MLTIDMSVAPGNADAVCLYHHIGMAAALWWFEPVGGKFDQQSQRILEVDRIHKAAVLWSGMRDPAGVKPLGNLPEACLTDVEGEMVHASRVRGGAPWVRLAGFIGEYRNEPPVAGIKIKMTLVRRVKVGLIENKGHTQNAFPEVDGGLPVCSGQRDMVHTLSLQLSQSGVGHVRFPYISIMI